MTTAITLNLPALLTTTDECLSSQPCQIAVKTLAGAVAGYVLGIASPVGGAVFGFVFSISALLGSTVIDKMGIENEQTKTALRVAKFVISLSLAVSSTAFVGFAMSALGSIGMILGMAGFTVLTYMVCSPNDP